MNTPPGPIKSPAKYRLRRGLQLWHRRLGVVAGVVLLIIAVTGVLLNHTATLQLGHASVRAPWLLQLYGLPLPDVQSYRVGPAWVSGDALGGLYVGGRRSGECQGKIVGAVAYEAALLVACTHELLLVSEREGVLERLGFDYGVPVPIESLGHCGEQPCLGHQGEVWAADVAQVEWTLLRDVQPQWSAVELLPVDLLGAVKSQIQSPLTLERLMLDLHSGRLFGSVGVVVFDLAAVVLVLLVFSGWWLWWRRGMRG